MTKHHRKLSFIAIIILVSLLMVLRYISQDKTTKSRDEKPTATVEAKKVAPVVNVEKKTIDGRKVLGLPPGEEEETLKDIQVANSPSEDWEENLEEALRVQGGSSLKDISIKKIDSFVMLRDKVALNVESAIVTLKDDKGSVTKFKVLVDSETGKILQNWDQPVIDPINPRENFGIKVDPRYHQD